ncbi:MAG: hypothetical protein RR744_02605 [Cellulosilyticaceae bacterium]
MILYFILILLPPILMLFTSFKNISFGDKTLLFGVRLPVEFKKTERIDDIIKSYKKANILNAIGLIIISSILTFTLPEEFVVTIGIVSIVYMTITLFITFFIANKKVKSIKEDEKWNGYTKNVVIIDLNNKKNIGSFRGQWVVFLVPLLVIVFTLMIMIYSYNGIKDSFIPGLNQVIFSDKVSLFGYIYPVYIQIAMFIILVLSGIMITKSKQIINGGEVEKIKELNIRLKKLNLFYLAIITTIVEGIFLIIAVSNSATSMYFALAAVIVLFIMAAILIIYYEKIIKEYKVVDQSSDVVNRDDDIFYKMGMFYYNPNDPSNIVPKRVGAGVDFNYGKVGIRIGSFIFIGIITIILMFTAFYLPFDMCEKNPIITNNTLKISGMYSVEVNRNEIEGISLENLPKNIIKTNGAGLNTKLYGNFKINNVIKSKMYISNSDIKAVKIELKNGNVIYINHNDMEKTKKLYTLINNFAK